MYKLYYYKSKLPWLSSSSSSMQKWSWEDGSKTELLDGKTTACNNQCTKT